MNNTSAANVSRTNDHRLSENAPSKAEGIAWCTAFILTFVLTVAGNLLTIIIFTKSKSNRKKHVFLPVNMAFADLMLGAVALPLYIYHVGFTFHLWTITESFTSKPLDIFFMIVDTAFTQASLISAAFISCERFYAVYWPFKHRTLSKRAYGIIIFVVWILALLASAIWTVLTFVFTFSPATTFLAPYVLILILIMCGCNLAIWRNFQNGSVSASHQQNRDLQNKRLTKTLLFVSGLTLLAWLPVMILNFLIFVWSVPVHWKLYHMVNLFNYFNSLINPVVYALRIPEFRQALHSCCFGKQPALNMTLDKITNERTGTTDISHELALKHQNEMDTAL